jgi:hypothetical protein
MVVENLTLQPYEWWRTCKPGQILLIEYSFDLGVELCFLVTMFILQLHPDLAPKLLVLGEHRYHRDLRNACVNPSS